MCSVKKVATPPPPKGGEKQPVYMQNSYLDGLGINSENAGRNSLRIDLGGAAPRPPSARPPTTVVLPPGPTGPLGIGRGNGGSRNNGLGIGGRRQLL